VKWSRWYLTFNYLAERLKVKQVGHETAKMLKFITKNMKNGMDKVHLIGHSLGAQIVGYCGEKLNGEIPRITGKFYEVVKVEWF